MEEITTSFFINGLKISIESSLNKIKEKNELIFESDFENSVINPLFINNINLFREIITKNNLNFKIFWNHIVNIMNSSILNIISKFEEEIKTKKENNNKEDNNNEINLIEQGEINILKLKIVNICLDLIVNEEYDSSNFEKGKNKEEFKKLLEILITKEIKNNKDFSLFIKNYIVMLDLLINNEGKEINIGFLKYLSTILYSFEFSFNKNELIKQLYVYVNQVINNPRLYINNYSGGANNKKKYNKERISRSRRASFDIKDTNINSTEKKNKKIMDYFKKEPKKGNENKKNENIINEENKNLKKSSLNNLLNKKKEFNDKDEIIKKNEEKLRCYFSNESNKSLFNFDSNISKKTNSIFLSNNSLSIFKNNNFNSSNNSILSLDDSLDMSKIFSTPLSELNEENENKEKKNFEFKFPSIIKCLKTKKRKPLDKLKNLLFNSQMNIKKYINKGNKNRIENENKEIKELRKVVNYDFYGNEKKENEKEIKENLINKKHNQEIKINKIENKENINENILIAKTPIKNDNQENKDLNVQESMNLNKLKKSWQILFSQNTNL